jgi:sucrose phosphorylase
LERDALIIAYGDHVQAAGEAPLQTLHRVLRALELPPNGLHILPFYPYSSDDGFSVIDYEQVDPALGTWDDIHRLSHDYRLMFDAVFNHMSAQSTWFAAFRRGEPPYDRFFITADPTQDWSQVTRPRALPLLTPVETVGGTRHVWTTFSADQVDLNVTEPTVLLALTQLLLQYVRHGASMIRLDAIAFLWKRAGTTCIHLPETHTVIRIWRDVLDLAAPHVLLITETNVPHAENLSYFGDGSDEAQLVYQFPLPPLIAFSLLTGDARYLLEWAVSLMPLSQQTTFFNFTASHDGVGMRPITGILTDAERDQLVQTALAHGGHVSYKANCDGTLSPYELNVTYFDLINAPDRTAADPTTAVRRFLCSQAIMLAMIGVPGVYLPSLFGGRNDAEGVIRTGHARAINRRKYDADDLLAELADPSTLSAQVLAGYRRLLAVRCAEPAFYPHGTQTVHRGDDRIVALERGAPDGTSRVLTLHNVSGETVQYPLPDAGWAGATDLLGGVQPPDGEQVGVLLAPYAVVWLKARPNESSQWVAAGTGSQ